MPYMLPIVEPAGRRAEAYAATAGDDRMRPGPSDEALRPDRAATLAPAS
jgi:hypothetical protein